MPCYVRRCGEHKDTLALGEQHPLLQKSRFATIALAFNTKAFCMRATGNPSITAIYSRRCCCLVNVHYLICGLIGPRGITSLSKHFSYFVEHSLTTLLWNCSSSAAKRKNLQNLNTGIHSNCRKKDLKTKGDSQMFPGHCGSPQSSEINGCYREHFVQVT